MLYIPWRRTFNVGLYVFVVRATIYSFCVRLAQEITSWPHGECGVHTYGRKTSDKAARKNYLLQWTWKEVYRSIAERGLTHGPCTWSWHQLRWRRQWCRGDDGSIRYFGSLPSTNVDHGRRPPIVGNDGVWINSESAAREQALSWEICYHSTICMLGPHPINYWKPHEPKERATEFQTITAEIAVWQNRLHEGHSSACTRKAYILGALPNISPVLKGARSYDDLMCLITF